MKSGAQALDARLVDLDFSHGCMAAIWRLFAFIETARACRSIAHAPELAHINSASSLRTAKHRALCRRLGKVGTSRQCTRVGVSPSARNSSVATNADGRSWVAERSACQNIRMSTRLNDVARMLTDGTICRVSAPVELDGVGQMPTRSRGASRQRPSTAG